jgi:S-adenosyl methyltransferase
VLDFSQPVAVMMLGLLHCIPDEDDPAALVARVMAAVSPGSYLVIAHPASDVAEQLSRSMGDYNKQAAAPLTARSYAEVSNFFAGLTWSSRVSSSCTGGGQEPQTWARAES